MLPSRRVSALAETRETRPVANEAGEGLSTAIKNEQESSAAACPRCRYSGVLFPDEQRRCPTHASPEQHAEVTELDRAAEAAGLRRAVVGDAFRRFAWPYGPNIDVSARGRLLEWMTAHRLQPAPPERSRCVCQIVHGRCKRPHADDFELLGWRDHSTLWMRGGRPAVLVAQPYQLTPYDVERLAALDAHAGIHLELRGEGSWYGHGTWFIGVWRADA